VWEEAVIVLACSLLCDQLAAFYEGTAMPEPGGLVLINAGEKADGYRTQGQTLLDLYQSLTDQSPVAATPTVERKRKEEKANV